MLDLVVGVLMGLGAGPEYTETRREAVTEVMHGVDVKDPYRWLENDVREDTEVADWVARQNQVTQRYLGGLNGRDEIHRRLEQIWNYEKYSAPLKAGQRYYYQKNNGLQNQAVLYVQEELEGEGEVLLDPNGWSEDGTVALRNLQFSHQGNYLALGVSEAGSDWMTWQVMDLRTREVLPERVEWGKYTNAYWTPDEKGFFYGRFEKPGELFQSQTLNHQIFYHRVGTQQSEDVLAFSWPSEPTWNFEPAVSEDGHYLIIHVWVNSDDVRVFYRDLREPYGFPVGLINAFENKYFFLGNDGPVLYFLTDRAAPRQRVVAIDTRNPAEEHWRTLVPEQEDSVESASVVNDQFILTYLRDAKNIVRIFSLDGQPVREIGLPGIGSARGFDGLRTDRETFFTFSSFATAPQVYHVRLDTGESTLWREAQVDFSSDEFVVEQVFYSSKDGTRVPMFLTRKKDVALNGELPTLLYGYGGFGISMTPFFSPVRVAWLEMGGVYAVPNIRGGGEYGRAWHEGGKSEHKQNGFDDFIAAAEWLIANNYTKPEKLAVQGGSNGGLLVGAVMTQRPELIGVALPAVGVLDMLRFSNFTAGRYWTDEYGDREKEEDFKRLFAFSPYHNLRAGTCYPATLVTTGDTDDRVVPSHSFKFAAALQAAQGCEKPVLIRIETRAGHGAGKPTDKQIEEVADQLVFLKANLEMN